VNTCKSESDLVDYRNLVSSFNANAAKGVSPNVQKVLNTLDDFKAQGGTVT